MHVDDAKLTHESAIHDQNTRSGRFNNQQTGRCARAVITLASLLGFLIGIATTAWPLQAAMILNYFDVLVDAEKVTLEWSTASENEVLGFEVDCKEEDEPVSQYHLIGKRIAQGNKDHGAIYRFDVMEGLEPNTSYCFRLREITLNNEQGEIIDRCGYGLSITPTPAATPIVPLEVTAQLSTPVTTTSTAIFTPTIIVTSTVVQPIVVTATPTPIITPTITSVDGQPLPEPNIPQDIPVIPTLTLTPFSESPLLPPITATATPTSFDQTSAAVIADTSAASEAADNRLSIAGVDPPYIILTVTPTEMALAVAPTFTPFPTALIDAEANLVMTTLPNTQNLMILLLCGVFSGASGLGILGLVTTLLYMRSRATDQQTMRKQ